MSTEVDQIAGVILAGGKGTRMGTTAKPLLCLGDKPIVHHVIEAARPQIGELIISANNDISTYQTLASEVVQDELNDYQGPMAGILAALRWITQNRPNIHYLACFPGDAPWFPLDLVEQMSQALHSSGASIAWIENDGQRQPLFSLWKTVNLEPLSEAIAQGMVSPMTFINQQDNVLLQLSGCEPGHFVNLNFPDDLEKAIALIDSHSTVGLKT